MVKKKNYSFTLRNINFYEIFSKNTITELETSIQEKKEIFYSFYDPQKNKIQMVLGMCNYYTKKILPLSTNYPCWWCKYEFSNSPIGLPIRYHENNPYIKEYEKFLKEANLTSDSNSFFETEGNFCSFSCCKSYILDNFSKYKNSLTLLSLMYSKLFENNPIDCQIKKSPDWRLLDRWLGSIKIEDFRNSINEFIYYSTPNTRKPIMFSTGVYFEEVKN